MGSPVTQTRNPAGQQPEWADASQAERVRTILAERPPLVRAEDVRGLGDQLAGVARGETHVLQAGDCAEHPDECTAEHVARKSALLHLLGDTLQAATGTPVVRVGRIAGQFAKPRSHLVEPVDGVDLPVYRGHMVNAPTRDLAGRRHDPLRMLTAYRAARDVMEHLGWFGPAGEAQHPGTGTPAPIWTSHEALVLDYEFPLARDLDDGRRLLGSAHWPWIGKRTHQLHGAHVDLVSEVLNPVAVKVGPTITPADLTALCARLDPQRRPGRLTLIARMGADAARSRLAPLVRTVRRAGHPVIWLCDPMHGNTVTTPDGHKTRLLPTMAEEVRAFCRAVAGAGGIAGGLHLETTPDDVTECAPDFRTLDSPGIRRTTLCDPRLNPEQAVALVAAWGRDD
ncbi:3-deoxy-7-phosphoheptulonate synthase [Streptomyces pacificus]|uniref:Phospho-2-dehydro-3-deoxyheptonate aldolase n=1 Tax=Streptomyces pacificus TaxID=2705029 RepID=A0A6A0AQA7_9ACTN|nr:3-deoxy-7-phosphoheptulonate synthase [Streptomyces pacificus]GFH34828.1 phospho-2-dehydro-3-deoxyheptonate aldolase [Streptomyces pacificus]